MTVPVSPLLVSSSAASPAHSSSVWLDSWFTSCPERCHLPCTPAPSLLLWQLELDFSDYLTNEQRNRSSWNSLF